MPGSPPVPWCILYHGNLLQHSFLSPCALLCLRLVYQVIFGILLGKRLVPPSLSPENQENGDNRRKSRWALNTKLTLMLLYIVGSLWAIVCDESSQELVPGLISMLVASFIVFAYYCEAAGKKMREGLSDVILLYLMFGVLSHGMESWAEHLKGLGEQAPTTTGASGPLSLLALLHFLLAADCFLLFILEWCVPRRSAKDFEKPDVISRAFYCWLNELLKKSFEQTIGQDDLPQLRKGFDVDSLSQKFLDIWRNSPKTPRGLCVSLIQTFKFQILALVGIKLVDDCCAFIEPFVLAKIINFVGEHSTVAPRPESGWALPSATSDTVYRGVYLSLLLLMLSMTRAIVLNRALMNAIEIITGCRAVLYGTLYRKAMVLSPKAREINSPGEIMNHLSVDADQITSCVDELGDVITAPFQFMLCFVALYKLLGLYFLVGIFTILLVIPFNSYFTRKTRWAASKTIACTDERVKLVSSILSNIKSLKLYAWERPFLKRLTVMRDKELHYLKKLRTFNAPVEGIWDLQPFILAASTFGALSMFGPSQHLSAEVIFPCLAVFNFIKNPMILFPNALIRITQSWVSFTRLSRYLGSPEISASQTDALFKESPEGHVSGIMYHDDSLSTADEVEATSVLLRDADVAWNEDVDSAHALHHVNFSARKGDLCCIIGRVGCGKSALCKTLCGLLHVRSGQVSVSGTISYVGQSAWLRSQSVRENIIFNAKYDADWYQEVIIACALVADLKQLSHGDQTLVGEKPGFFSLANQGVSLCGGQRARISLARAIYSGADVIVIDDALAAVDELVSAHLVKKVFSRRSGILRNKTVILATNSFKVLKEATNVSLIEQGRLFQGYTGWNSNAAVTDSERGPDEKQKSREEILAEPDQLDDDYEDLLEETLIDEKMETGKVRSHLYWNYIKAGGISMFCLFFALVVFVGMVSAYSTVWLKTWSDDTTKRDTPVVNAMDNDSSKYYLSMYLLIGLAFALSNMTCAYVFTVTFGINASRKIHNDMARSVLRSPMEFFETTPLGRILNRFTTDVGFILDQRAVWVCYDMVGFTFRILSSVLVIVWSTPVVLIPFVPLTGLYVYYQQYYVRSCRQLKRLERTNKSPVMAHFDESLKGIEVIKTFGYADIFVQLNDSHANKNVQAEVISLAVDRWVSVRLQLIGALINFCTAMGGMFMATNGSMTKGLIGLAIANSMEVVSRMVVYVRMSVQTERIGVTLERMYEYSHLPSEAEEIIDCCRPPAYWPTQGDVNFDNYSVRYRQGQDLALRDVNLSISPREKIGVVGRTGAGKSTLTLALFRILEAAGGTLTINGIDVSTIGLLDLRRRLSIIPQDAEIFAASVRENLDPFEEHEDYELWRALEMCHLKEHVTSSLDGGLDSMLQDGGRNLSRGQAQLMCLARALLNESNILVLDEATASVDPDTDAIIQQTIRKEFKNKTIVTVAHRLNTIMDSDRIIVLEKGKIIEVGRPGELKENTDSAFSKLVRGQ